MPQELLVTLDIVDEILAKHIVRELADLPYIRLEKKIGTLENGFPPQVIILDDQPDNDEIFSKLTNLRQRYREGAIYVISQEKTPEHIVDVMRAGAAEYFINPLNPDKLRAALERRRAQLSLVAPLVRGTIYSFISSKGGLGSTILAVNTAAAMAMAGRDDIAFVDMSLQTGDSSVLLDLTPTSTIVDVSKNFHRLDHALLKGAMNHHPVGIDVLPAPPSMEDSLTIHAPHVTKILTMTQSLYGTVIVDCPSMVLNECSEETFKLSEKIFVVTDLSVPAIRNANRLLKTIQQMGISLSKVEVNVNRFIKGKTPASLDDIEKTLGKRIFWFFPNDFDFAISSINCGTPLVKSHPRTPLAKNIQDFIAKLQNPLAHQHYRGVKGFLGRDL